MFDDSMAVAADWETFYDVKSGYSLSAMPTWQYCADRRFDPYLLALCGTDIYDSSVFEREPADGEVTVFGEHGDMFRRLADGRQLFVGRAERFKWWDRIDGRIIACHNCSFDKAVFLECWKRGMLPKLNNVQWVCTADLSAFLMAPRNLKGAMKELFGKEISKEVREGMSGRHDFDLNPEEYRALVEYGGSDAVECHDIWLKYSHEFPYMERRISELNRDSTMRGIKLDADALRAAIKELESYLAVVACDIPWYPEKALGSLPALKKAVMDMGLVPPKSFKKDDAGFLRWQDEHGDIKFIKARQRAISISMCLARLKTMLETLDGDGRSHPVFMYFGAHTGRFSGKSDAGGNLNLLNLPRKPVLSGDEHVFGGKGVDIRGMYIADPGHSFYVADYAQIESRMSLWLVNDTHMAEALKREGNLYTANAVAMGWCKSGDDIKHDKPDLYRLAKCCLTEDTLVLVRSERPDGGLTSPSYKRIIHITPMDRVWDGHEWVRHLGVEKMKEVDENELRDIGGVWATHDHKVFAAEHEVHQFDNVCRGREEATVVAWGQSTNPVQGWTHVRLLAAALARLGAETVCLAVRKAAFGLLRSLRVYGVRKRSAADVEQRQERTDDAVRQLRIEGNQTDNAAACLGEGA